MRKKKSKFYIGFLAFLPIFSISALSISNSFKEKSLLENFDITNRDLNAISGEEQQIKATWKYTNNNINQVSWYGQKTPSQVTTNDILSLLNFDKNTESITIQLLPKTSAHITDGYIEFKVVQTIKNYTSNGITTKRVELPVNGATSSGSQAANTTWSTKEFSGLIISSKYNFAWRSNEEISQFLDTTTLTYDDIATTEANRKNEITQILLNNLVQKGDAFNLPSNATYSVSNVTSNQANDKKYGAIKITFSFGQTTATDWVNNTMPTANQLTKTIRGIASSDGPGTSTTMDIVSNTNLSSYTILDTNMFSNYLNNGQNKLTDLYPSEFLNFGKTNSDALLNLLTKNMYLDNTNVSPIIQLSYYGIDVANNSNATATTGLTADIINELGITSVSGVANDKDGSLMLSYEYSYYDVRSDTIVRPSADSSLGKGLLKFPVKTFAINPDADKNLQFMWKNSTSLTIMNSSYNVVNEFEENKDNPEYLKALSNVFFDGTNDVYEKARNVEIAYKSGNSATKDASGKTIPNTPNDSSIIIRLTFDSWNGHQYTNSSGVTVDGFYAEQEFNLKSYQSLVSGVSWKTQEQVRNAIANYETTIASDVADKIITGEISLSTFLDNANNNSVSVDVVPVTGSLVISVQNGDNIESKVFTGMLPTQDNNVEQFSWISENEIDPTLLSMNLETIVNDKSIIIDKYLNNIPLFASHNISPDNITMTPNYDNNTLLLSVVIDRYNQTQPDSSKTFTIELRGFIKTNVVDANTYAAPLDLTIILSCVFAILISGILIGVLVWIIVKGQKLKKAQNKNKLKTEEK